MPPLPMPASDSMNKRRFAYLVVLGILFQLSLLSLISEKINLSSIPISQGSNNKDSSQEYHRPARIFNLSEPYNAHNFWNDSLSYPGFREATLPLDYDKNFKKNFSNSTKTCEWTAQRLFFSGFRNQMRALASILMIAVTREGCNQFLLKSLQQKDTFGSEQPIPHQALFDIPHFNAQVEPTIRFIICPPLSVIDGENASPHLECHNATGITTPQPHLSMIYQRYSELTGKAKLARPGKRHPVDLAIMQGAYQPHPWLREIINSLLQEKFQTNKPISKDQYFTLHARVEPEMIRHVMCRNKKEVNLTKIFAMVEEAFPDPPASFLLLLINRENMETEGDPNNPKMQSFHNETNYIAVENLERLNRAVDEGLWGGQVQVFEFGSYMLKGTRYSRRASITGGLINYYIALESKVFIGTEISTYSTDLMTQRFYQSKKMNYKYLPSGIERWTDNSTRIPETFRC